MSNKDKINDYVRTINQRTLVEEEYYDATTKEYNIGSIWVHEGLGYFEIRRVEDEKGDYVVVGEGEMKTEEEVVHCLAGILAGHILTLDSLDMEYNETEYTLENIDQQENLTDSQKAAIKEFLKNPDGGVPEVE